MKTLAAVLALLLLLLPPDPVVAAPATFDDLSAYGAVDASNADGVSLLLNQAYLEVLDRTPAAGIAGWLGRERQRTRTNIERARAAAADRGPAGDARFAAAARRFVTAYAAEQIRLARVFARTPSEIEAYPGERAGWELPDRTLVLTFDDGPLPATTTRVLGALRTHQAPAAFFVLGNKVSVSGRRVDYRGFAVGSHTWSHLMIAEASVTALQNEIQRTRDAIVAAGIVPSKWFRAPYGARRPRDLEIVARDGLRSVIWNIDSQDWQDSMQRVRDRIANRVIALALLRRRGIVLCHDTVPATAAMIDGLIPRLRALGYRFESL